MDRVAIPAIDPPNYTLVAARESYLAMLDALRPASRLAMDIEADSLYHYFEKVCLLQISTDRDTFVLDTLAIRDLSALAPTMSDGGTEKVFHAAAYDTYCLRRDHGFSFENIFDTHVAAHLAGYEQLGLGALMEGLLGIVHSKRRQRDDWSKRPLDADQLRYAAMDTHHLLALRDVLERELEAKGRLSWAREEFACAAKAVPQERVFDPHGYRRIKGSRDLSPKELLVLRALYLVRERIAQELDVPPFKVMNNAVLLDLARRPPARPADLLGRPGISRRLARRWAVELCRAIQRTANEDPSRLARPARTPWEPPPPEVTARLEALKQWRLSRSRELGLSVGVVFPGNLLEALAGSPPPDLESLAALEGMRHWRVNEFGQEILGILRRV